MGPTGSPVGQIPSRHFGFRKDKYEYGQFQAGEITCGTIRALVRLMCMAMTCLMSRTKIHFSSHRCGGNNDYHNLSFRRTKMNFQSLQHLISLTFVNQFPALNQQIFRGSVCLKLYFRVVSSSSEVRM